MTNSGGLPLSGIRVADFGQFIAIPSATQQFAEMGADVIKVEPPGGEISRNLGMFGESMLRGSNRGKRSIVLDLKHPRDVAVAERLIASSDVICHNLRPGTMERLGFGVERVRDLNPGIINVSVTGYGPHGPSATRAGLDIAAQAESGLMSVTGEADGDPQRVGVAVVDQTTAYLVVQAVLAALLRRERTGLGDDIQIALLDTAIHMQTMNWMQQDVTGVPARRKGNGQPNMAMAAEVFKASDGHFVLSAYKPEHFARLCEAIGRPSMVHDEKYADARGRLINRRELLDIVGSAFSDRPVQECVKDLSDAGLVSAVIREYENVLTAADVVDNETFVQATAVDGTSFSVPVPPARSSLFDPAVVGGRVPALGEHTAEILAELSLENAVAAGNE